MGNILEVKNLNIEYDVRSGFLGCNIKKNLAVKKVSFDLKEGEVLGIIGESGSGKSSLIKAIAGINKVKSGDIIYNEKYYINKFKSKKEWRPIRSDIQMIFQNPSASLDPNMTIYDIIAEPLLYSGKKYSKKQIDDEVDIMMKNVCLHPSFKTKYSEQCSGGQNQRVAIARALIQKPKILLCDEPVSALDVSTQAHIMNLLKDMKDKFDLTIIFISHDLNVVHYIADNIFVMYKGEIIERDKCSEIYRNPKHDYTKMLVNSLL